MNYSLRDGPIHNIEEYMYVEDKEYLYIYTLHTDFIGNSVKLSNSHNFYLRVLENTKDMTVTAIWKKPMRNPFDRRWFVAITVTNFIIRWVQSTNLKQWMIWHAPKM